MIPARARDAADGAWLLPRSHALGAPAAAAAACWPAWPWCFGAWRSPDYSHLGLWLLLGAAVAAAASLIAAPQRRLSPGWLGASAALTIAYAAAYRAVPHTFSAALALAALAAAWLAVSGGVTLAGRHGIAAMILLAMPVGGGSDYYVGFPLRMLVTRAAAFVLGPGVEAVGTALSNGADTVFVDAPCAGLRMIGVALGLGAVLAAAARCNAPHTLALLCVGGIIALAGNATRAVALYFVETQPALEGLSHDAIGLAVFAGCSALQVALAWPWLARRNAPPPPAPPEQAPHPAAAWAACAAMAAAVACAPGLVQRDAWAGAPPAAPRAARGWPQAWGGRALEAVPLSPSAREGLADFPGEVAEFRVAGGGESVLLRRVDGWTRRLHPAELCYRGFGWTCTPRPAFRDAQGRLWSCFEARRADGALFMVRQLYAAIDPAPAHDLGDRLSGAATWPDAGSWFWAAAMPGSGISSTLAITHSIPLPSGA